MAVHADLPLPLFVETYLRLRRDGHIGGPWLLGIPKPPKPIQTELPLAIDSSPELATSTKTKATRPRTDLGYMLPEKKS